jgi:hypothetical protein
MEEEEMEGEEEEEEAGEEEEEGEDEEQDVFLKPPEDDEDEEEEGQDFHYVPKVQGDKDLWINRQRQEKKLETKMSREEQEYVCKTPGCKFR